MTDVLHSEISSFLRFERREPRAPLTVLDEVPLDGYTRKLVSYGAPDGEPVQAFLFEPRSPKLQAAVIVLHQHNSEWALGKSEVAGLAGDPLQAFGPALARAGVLVFAPDVVGFESRWGRPGDGRELAPPINKPHGSAEGWL